MEWTSDDAEKAKTNPWWPFKVVTFNPNMLIKSVGSNPPEGFPVGSPSCQDHTWVTAVAESSVPEGFVSVGQVILKGSSTYSAAASDYGIQNLLFIADDDRFRQRFTGFSDYTKRHCVTGDEDYFIMEMKSPDGFSALCSVCASASIGPLNVHSSPSYTYWENPKLYFGDSYSKSWPHAVSNSLLVQSKAQELIRDQKIVNDSDCDCHTNENDNHDFYNLYYPSIGFNPYLVNFDTRNRDQGIRVALMTYKTFKDCCDSKQSDQMTSHPSLFPNGCDGLKSINSTCVESTGGESNLPISITAAPSHKIIVFSMIAVAVLVVVIIVSYKLFRRRETKTGQSDKGQFV